MPRCDRWWHLRPPRPNPRFLVRPGAALRGIRDGREFIQLPGETLGILFNLRQLGFGVSGAFLEWSGARLDCASDTQVGIAEADLGRQQLARAVATALDFKIQATQDLGLRVVCAATQKPPFVLTLVCPSRRTVVSTPLLSRMTNVSASRRVTTPLIFIFSPLATVRAPAAEVWSCAKATDAENANRETASMRGQNSKLRDCHKLSPSLKCAAHAGELGRLISEEHLFLVTAVSAIM